MEHTSSNHQKPSTFLIFLLALACGILIANIYYAQPLLETICQDLHLSLKSAGLIATFTQLGYVAGLLFIVPLSDFMENRKLFFSVTLLLIASLLSIFFVKQGLLLFLLSAMLGLGSVATQLLVPYAAYIAPIEMRGSIVGRVMSGLLLGIMLARPISGYLAEFYGWRVVFLLSAGVVFFLLILLYFYLPKKQPVVSITYKKGLQSLVKIFVQSSTLRKRALYQACLFGSFSLFWTVAPLWLHHHFHLSSVEIAIFSLVGVAGAIAAPIAGHLADHGDIRKLTGITITIGILSFIGMNLSPFYGQSELYCIAIAAIFLDMAVSGNLVLSQRLIYSLGDEIRGRVNGLFMALFFIGGALGSCIGSWVYFIGQWEYATYAGILLCSLALLYYISHEFCESYLLEKEQ